MAPAKRGPSVPRPRADWTWTPEIDVPDRDITQEHLERALGLRSARRCENKVAVALELERARRGDDDDQDEDEIEDDEDELEKGKKEGGKAKVVEVIDIDAEDDVPKVRFQTTKKRTAFSSRDRGGASRGGTRNSPVTTTIVSNSVSAPTASLSRKRTKTNSSSKNGGVGPPCTANWCRGNLLCLNSVGGKQWLDPAAKETFFRLHKLGPNPGLEQRDPILPVGLRNLGATCYANAFLQLWYRILPFRAAVYACATDPTMPSTSPCFQLALTFTGLQKSARSVFDPAGLVEALRLEKGDQQDASEFSKLFMALLQTEFSKNEDAKVKSVINDQFEGKLKYRTECMSCGYVSERPENFLELEISMEGSESSLINRLQKSLEAETLDGDNQYRCSRCDQLRDARRSVQIDSVPPTLNFSLLRFVFDPKTFDRKKSKTTIKFPPRINMRPYMSETEGKELWYELKGVIEHKGTSAHHGHFVAKVYDSEAQQWILCDDETTTKIRPMTALPVTQGNGTTSNEAILIEDPIEDDDDADELNLKSNVQNGKRPLSRNNTRRSKSREDEVIVTGSRSRQRSTTAEVAAQSHKSQQAYMLVYGLASDDDTEHNPVPVPAKRTGEQIEAQNLAWEADGEAFEKKQAALSAEFDRIKQAKVDIVSTWDVEAEEDGRFVYLKTLVDWVERGLIERPEVKPKASRQGVDSRNDLVINEEEQINGKPAGMANCDAEVTDGQKKVLPPGRSANSDVKDDTVQVEDGEVEMKPPAMDKIDISKENGKEPPITEPSDDSDPLRCFLSNRRIRCVHQKLNPDKGCDMRYISKDAHDRMKALGTVFDCDFGKEDICKICVTEEYIGRDDDDVHWDAIQEFKAAREMKPSQTDVAFLVSSQWLKAWRKEEWRDLKDGKEEDWWDRCKAEIYCLHQAAKTPDQRGSCETVNSMAHAILISDDPDAIAVSSADECKQCGEEEEKLKIAKSADIRQAETEQALLKTVLRKKDDDGIVLVDDVDNYIIPTSFFRNWQSYVKDPVHNPRPLLSNEPFFCAHGQINVDFGYNPDKKSDKLYTLLPSDWQQLQSLYTMKDNEIITVHPSRSGKFGALPVVNKELCKPCWQERITGNAEKIRLWVRLAEDEVKVPGESSTPNENAMEVEEPRQDEKKQSNGSGRKKSPIEIDANETSTATRRSNRLITRNSKAKEEAFTLRKHETLLDLKKEIECSWHIPAFYQRLYYDGHDIDDNMMTITGAGIVFDAVVYVKNCAEDMHGDMDDVEHVPSTRAERAAGGFHNTLLHGLPVDESSSEEPTEAAPDVEMEGTAPESKACPACTFINQPGFLVCEICEAQL